MKSQPLTLIFAALSTLGSGCAPIPQGPSIPNPTISCFETAIADVSFAPIRTKMVLGLERPTLDMQADATTPTNVERDQILAYARVRDRCNAEGEAWRTRYVPTAAYRSIATQIIGRIDASVAALYRGDLTFGKYNIQLEALRLEGRRLQDDARAIEQRETDSARRQAALEVLLATPREQAARSVPRTANTNCQVLGSQMYCTTTNR